MIFLCKIKLDQILILFKKNKIIQYIPLNKIIFQLKKKLIVYLIKNYKKIIHY